MGQQDYMPKTYEPIVPPHPTIPVPPAFQSPPHIAPPPQPIMAPVSPPPGQTETSGGGTFSGNGLPYCSGKNSPGYNVSTGKCSPISTSTNAIVPQQTQPQVLKLSSLPYTGDSSMDTEMSAALYVLIIGLALSGIGLILKRYDHSS